VVLEEGRAEGTEGIMTPGITDTPDDAGSEFKGPSIISF
jgi:hypothetical protein